MDRFADHVVDPAVRHFFLDGRPRPDLSEANQAAYGAAVESLRVPNEPLLYYAMGAFWGDWLVNHRGAKWALEAPLNPLQSFPDMITSSHTACLHPFSQVNKRLSDPEGDNLEFKCSPELVRKYVPPLPLIASLADADRATEQLLPPAGRRARALLEAGDAERAFDLFRSALAESPRNAPLLSQAAACALSAEQYEAAEEWMRRLLAMHPDIPLINHNLAIVVSMGGKTDEAIRLLRHAIRMDPNYARARITLASMLAETGQTAEAVELAQWVVENENDERLLSDARGFLSQIGQ
jgi:tetratricopeptide (TPR) repeat protein